ncbi:uncharacterized protein DS421_13g414210 [Arachis hypogaea]|nr:uncharacterized protein DS421_13g414210 [Arachis hypogaea]
MYDKNRKNKDTDKLYLYFNHPILDEVNLSSEEEDNGLHHQDLMRMIVKKRLGLVEEKVKHSGKKKGQSLKKVGKKGAEMRPCSFKKSAGVLEGYFKKGVPKKSDAKMGSSNNKGGFETPHSFENEQDGFNWPQYNDGAEFGEVQFSINMEFVILDQFDKAFKDYIISKAKRESEANVEEREEDNVNKPSHEVAEGSSGQLETNVLKDVGAGGGVVETVQSTNNEEYQQNYYPWLIYCAWKIKTYNLAHTCAREFGSSMVDCGWVTTKWRRDYSPSLT